MAKSVVSMDNLDWAIKLGCPPLACTNTVKEILNRGISSYMWDEVSSQIYSINDVIETRKNILLYYLKNQISVSTIQHIKNIRRLKAEREIIASQIEQIHMKCAKTDTALQQNGLNLIKVKSQKKTEEIKKNILELKCQETRAGIADFEEMFLICQRLLPSEKNDINEAVMHQSLACAGAISSRADKRKALKQLSEYLGSVAISDLWTWILKKRIQDTEELVNHGFKQESMEQTKKHDVQRLNIGIAKACGQHIISTTSKLLHMKKGEEERLRGISYMQKIENSMVNDANETFQEWLTLAIEVAHLEKNQFMMESEINNVKVIAQEADHLQIRHVELASEIHEIHLHMEQCANRIQQALIKFEPAGQSLVILKNQMMNALYTIASLNIQSNFDWLNKNLTTEIEMFQENFNIDALNKILLGGKIGAYRHITTCMSSVPIVSPEFMSSSPVYRTPLYHLIYCFGNLIANSILVNEKEKPDVIGHLDRTLNCTYLPSIRETNTLDLLYETSSTCEKTQSEIANFNTIYDSWVYQFVSEVMSMNKETVYGATYNEWLQRYTTLVYMIHRNK